MRSMTRKPMLWGVNWYSMPGLPSPTISFTPSSNLLYSAEFCWWTKDPPAVLLPFLLPGFFGLRGFLGSRLCAFLSLDFLLALLDDFGLCRHGASLGSNRFRRRSDFLLHRDHVSHGLIRIAEEFQSFAMRQIG